METHSYVCLCVWPPSQQLNTLTEQGTMSHIVHKHKMSQQRSVDKDLFSDENQDVAVQFGCVCSKSLFCLIYFNCLFLFHFNVLIGVAAFTWWEKWKELFCYCVMLSAPVSFRHPSVWSTGSTGQMPVEALAMPLAWLNSLYIVGVVLVKIKMPLISVFWEQNLQSCQYVRVSSERHLFDFSFFSAGQRNERDDSGCHCYGCSPSCVVWTLVKLCQTIGNRFHRAVKGPSVSGHKPVSKAAAGWKCSSLSSE